MAYQVSIHEPSVNGSLRDLEPATNGDLQQTGLISEDTKNTINRVYVALIGAFAIIGVIANFFIIVTFLKMGLKDTVTINFFCLALSDLGVTFSSLLTGISSTFWHLQYEGVVQLWIDPYVVFVQTMLVSSGMTTCSTLLTTYMAIQRCCCVIFPFHFRSVFTAQRSVYIVCGIGVVATAVICLYSSFYGAQLKTLPGTNLTYIGLEVRPHRYVVYDYLSWMQRFIINVGCQIVVSICVVTMGVGLRRSSEFRKKLTTTTTAKSQFHVSDSDETSPNNSQAQAPNKTQPGQDSQTSDVRVLKTVILVSVIFVVCNLPATGQALGMVVPGFDLFGRFHNLFIFFTSTKNASECLCSSINIFVYLKTNSKFQRVFWAFFQNL